MKYEYEVLRSMQRIAQLALPLMPLCFSMQASMQYQQKQV